MAERSQRIPRSSAPWLRLVTGSIVVITCLVLPASSLAEDPQVLARTLASALDYRARANAAEELGRTHDQAFLPDLERALRDPHPTVRAAVAIALGQIVALRSISLLEQMRTDQVASVRMHAERALEILRRQLPSASASAPQIVHTSYPATSVPRPIDWGGARYIVHVGDVRNNASSSVDVTTQFQDEVGLQIDNVNGAVAIRPNDSSAAAGARGHSLPQFRLNGTVARIEHRIEGGDRIVRCEVSLTLMTEPGGDLRSVLSGAATGRSSLRQSEADLVRETLAGAVGSAMSNASEAFRRAAER